jgi:superfamily II DNA or RNA helicase
MSFFVNANNNYDSQIENGLRKCQQGAIWAVKSHLTISNEPALLSLPTGAGKTALMMALAFELKAKCVLIITPSQIIRHQTAGKFLLLDDLVKIGVYDKTKLAKPKVKEQVHIPLHLNTVTGNT